MRTARCSVSTRCLDVLVLMVTVVSCGCVSETSQRALSTEPLLMKSQNGDRIEAALAIPVYAESVGVATARGEGPGYMAAEIIVEQPFEYQQGTTLAIPQPLSRGFGLVPWFFAGRGISVRQVMLVARRHKPTTLSQLWDRSKNMVVTFEPDASNSANARLSELFQQKSIDGTGLQGFDLTLLNITRNDSIDVRMNNVGMALLASYAK